MNVWIEDIRSRYNTIVNGIRAFLTRIIRDPTGSASDFQACLNEDERTFTSHVLDVTLETRM